MEDPRRVLALTQIAIAISAVLVPASGAAIEPASKAALARASAALAKGDLPSARQAADEAKKASKDPVEGGEATATALKILGDAAAKEERWSEAIKHYRAAAHASADQHRLWRMVNQRRAAAHDEAGQDERKKRVVELLSRDAELVRLSRASAVGKAGLPAAQRSLDEAIASLSRDRDRHRVAFARAVRAKVLASSGEPARALEAARSLTAADQPAFVRRMALEAAVRAAAAQNDLQQEVRFALQLDALLFAAHPAEDRRFMRSDRVRRACKKLEATEGAGRCAGLAKELTGEYSFEDPWRQRPKATVSAADIDQAQEPYLPLIGACIEAAVRARPDDAMFQDAEVKISWAVTSAGRTTEIEIAPRRYEKVFGACVRERVAWFRYPRGKDGSVQSVSIPYELDVDERLGFGWR